MIRLFCSLLVLIGIAILTAQTSGQPRIRITQLPKYGSLEDLSGQLLNANPADFRLGVYIFVPDIGWFGRPGDCGSSIQAQPDGSFTADITQVNFDPEATEIAVYAFSSGFAPPCVRNTATIPFAIERNAAAKVSYQRNPNTLRRIRFSGMDWVVKTSVGKTGPGPQAPNYFLDTPENVYVDSLGRLHLRITRCGDEWCSSEIFTEKSLGFGDYRVQVETDTSQLDPNTVLGLFTWNHAHVYNNRELDIELSRWGNQQSSFNAQFVLQPYTTPSNISRFVIPPNVQPMTHVLSWHRDRASFASTTPFGTTVNQWTATNTTGIPPNGAGTHFRLNFYLMNNQAPVSRVAQEVVISSFSFTPSAPEVGFGSSEISSNFAAKTITVPIETHDSACSWNLISNAPWINVIDSAGAGGGLPRLSLEENNGVARSGTVTLETKNCNAASRGELAVSQGALDCTVQFEPREVFTDFRAKLEEVRVKVHSSSCKVTFSSSAPWIQLDRVPDLGKQTEGVLSFKVQQGDTVFRSGGIQANIQTLPILQDAQNTIFTATPSPANACLAPGRKPAVSLFASSPVRYLQIRFGSPQGNLIAQFEHGTLAALDSWVEDGHQFYLTGKTEPGAVEMILASTRVSFQTNCTGSGAAGSAVVDGASFASPALVPGGIASLFGTGLSNRTAVPSSAGLPAELNGITIRLGTKAVPLFFVSAGQINFLVPRDLPPGRYPMYLNDAKVQDVVVVASAPTLFVANGGDISVPLGFGTVVGRAGAKPELPLFACEGTPAVCRAPLLDVRESEEVYFVLYATGLGSTSPEQLHVNLGDEAGQVMFAGPHPQFPGLDQVNVKFSKIQLREGLSLLRMKVGAMQSNAAALNLHLN